VCRSASFAQRPKSIARTTIANRVDSGEMARLRLRSKEIFLAAIEHPAGERSVFVERACGDDADLRDDVESLLAAHEGTDSEAAASNPPVDAFSAGEMFAGRYRMVARLGQGGMSDVWRADDLVLGMPVALKLMHATTPAGQTVLLNEVRLARRITHPAVCRVFDIGEEGGQPFLSMELVEGEDLDALVHRVGRLPPEKVADIGRQLCDALAAAHAQGILHRDLKPANILIDDNGSVRISDFGIAVMRDQRGPNTGVGTPGYMAPEQLTSGGSVSERTDIYALGLVLYELLVGRHSFDPARPPSDLPRPSTIVGGVPSALERVVMQALSADPRQRPASAREMAAALAVTAGGPAALRRRRWLAAAALAIAAVLALVWRFRVPGRADTLTEQDTILLADFVNTTGDPVFDGTLKVALAVALEQSPFIKVFPDERVAQALRLMNRPADERLARPVARELAQREQLKALVTGSIGSLGRNYVIAIEAISSRSGDVMAREQVEVAGKEQVLAALGQAAARMRETLGESLASIEKFDTPLPRATTSSLDALHAYALALDQDRLVARAGAVPHLKRAVDFDPDFALAHALLSGVYANSRRSALAPEFSRRAFELRDRVSERERFFISWRYYHDATQDWDKALELAQAWKATYPREAFAFNSLGAAFNALGQYHQAIEPLQTASRLDPSFVAPVESLGSTFMALNRYDDVLEVVRRVNVLRPDLLSVRRFAFLIAFVSGDPAAMTRELEAARRLPDARLAADWEARTSAFSGRVVTAHGLFRRAAQDAARDELPETAAQWSAADAEVHAAIGQCPDARADAEAALSLSRDNFTLERAGRALALCGAGAEASRLSNELVERFPDATLTRRIHVPVIAAALAHQSGDAARAIALLDAVRPYDRARGAEFWPPYVRGLAFLARKNGADAGREFDSILGHQGEAPDSILFALSHLGRARAAVLSEDVETARKEYDAFFEIWRNADADLPLLRDARREYGRLR
jgi:eukaryotic-like serine/threonine-protein kinase